MTKRRLIACLGASLAMIFASCASPMEQQAEQKLREELLAQHRDFLRATAGAASVQVSQPQSDVDAEFSPQRREQLERMGGPKAYTNQKFIIGSDLVGDLESNSVSLSLQRCIELSVKNNLDSRVASIQPAISQTRITQAQAAFDPEFFARATDTNLDTPRPPTLSSVNDAFGTQKSDTQELTTGIRKQLSTGGEVTIQTEMTKRFEDPSFFRVNRYYEANAAVTLRQPLLRRFGSDVANAEIYLSQNARGQAVADFKRQLMTTVADTEAAYWDLAFSRHRLLIQQRLLERTVEDRDRLRARAGVDASPLRLAEASAFVELRKGDVIRASNEVRSNSDKLKRLINDPQIPLSGETLIVPLDWPVDDAVTFNLLDAVTTALKHRPELQRLLLEIRDAGIRLRVADNLRLPDLTIEGTVRYNGLGLDTVGDAYDNLGDAKFIDYVLTGQFTMPLGNRAAEALMDQRKLERRAAVESYKRGAQQVLLDVKDTLRSLDALYRLVRTGRAGRIAASDNLRVIQEQEEAGVALTPEFLLDQKLNAQQRLADAEISEARSLADYNTALARFHQAQGTLLLRNGIDFKDAPAGDDGLTSDKYDVLGLDRLWGGRSEK
jgi:outer membrane protein